MRLSVPRPY